MYFGRTFRTPRRPLRPGSWRPLVFVASRQYADYDAAIDWGRRWSTGALRLRRQHQWSRSRSPGRCSRPSSTPGSRAVFNSRPRFSARSNPSTGYDGIEYELGPVGRRTVITFWVSCSISTESSTLSRSSSRHLTRSCSGQTSKDYRLEINFVTGSVILERVTPTSPDRPEPRPVGRGSSFPLRRYDEPGPDRPCPVSGNARLWGRAEPTGVLSMSAIALKLPDGSVRQVPAGTRPRDVAESIGKRLAQAAVAAKVNGDVVDLDRELPADRAEVSFQILTDKDPEALDVLRHSCAHVMARAVMRLFPGVQLAFGPTIENGFYYDIDSPDPDPRGGLPAHRGGDEEDRQAAAEPFERFERPTAEGRRLVARPEAGLQGRAHRRRAEEVPDRSASTARASSSTCAAGRTSRTPARSGRSSCSRIAGAYWKNDASRKQLQRLYGTAFFTQKDLDAYLTQIEEAKKRDHRVLGKQLKLFTISQLAGSGLILWMPKGATVRGICSRSFIKDELVKRGYSAGLHPAHRPAGAVPHQRPLPVLPRRPVPADVLQRRRRRARPVPVPAGDAATLDEKQEREVPRTARPGRLRCRRLPRRDDHRRRSSRPSTSYVAASCSTAMARRAAGVPRGQGRTRSGPTRCWSG